MLNVTDKIGETINMISTGPPQKLPGQMGCEAGRGARNY